MVTSDKRKLTFLDLVYPPISNQEAIWLEGDPEVESLLRSSDFYMIGARAEVTFDNPEPSESDMSFDVLLGAEVLDRVRINPFEIPAVVAARAEEPYLLWGPKIIKVFDRDPDDPAAELLEWFTTEKLVLDRSRELPGIEGFNRFLTAATYDLLYVGIAKVGDTFDRLIANGHKARMDILANEPQRRPGARVTDEVYLLMFRAEPLIIQTFAFIEDSDEAGDILTQTIDHKRVVADAEKAFVSLLRPGYNSVLFKQYPKGSDGLYGSEFVRYGYVIRENVILNTDHGTIRGGYDPTREMNSNAADGIFVEGDTVTVLRGDPTYGQPV